MALMFSTELSLGAAATPFLGHEPSNDLWQYYMTDKSRAEDKKSIPELGRYDDLAWSAPEQHLTIRAVSRIGIKHFPRIGAVGFYKDKYTGVSNILAPIHVVRELTAAPTLEASIVDGSLRVVITPPKDITYLCYRIVMRNEYFADERITYELDSLLPLPAVVGEYAVYAVGYNDNTNALSARSNDIVINVDAGKPTWAPDPAGGGGAAVEEMSVDTLDNIWNEVFTGGDVNE